MQVEIEHLASETNFSYNGNKYQRGWMTNNAKSIPENRRLGPVAEHNTLIAVRPILGGQVQSNSALGMWMAHSTIVSVDHD